MSSDQVIVDELHATAEKLMSQYSVCNYITDDCHPATETDVIAEEIHALNRESLMPASSNDEPQTLRS